MSQYSVIILCMTCFTMLIIIVMGFQFINILKDIDSKHKETKALILKYQSKLTAVETEKQKTIAEFLRSVKTGDENRR